MHSYEAKDTGSTTLSSAYWQSQTLRVMQNQPLQSLAMAPEAAVIKMSPLYIPSGRQSCW